jgi:hypothetical protein
MSGSSVGGVVGAAVGFFVGGPAGAQWGWMIGSAVGGYVDPQQIEGPRLKDLRGTTSAVGSVIPRAWGTAPVPCNVIWQQPGVTEHENSDNGKGGGTEQITFTYTRSYAVMFHLGEIAGVLQIKRNGKVVYDARDDDTLEEEYTNFGLTAAAALERISGQRAENTKFLDICTIYTGTQTQNPDPTIESYEGAGNVPSYRGRAYMVVTDDDVTDLQGAIPQYEVIVAACGSVNVVPSVGAEWVLGFDGFASVEISADGLSWPNAGFMPSPSWAPGGAAYSATNGSSVLLVTPVPTPDTEAFIFSDDRGATWSACTGLAIDSSGGDCLYSGGYWHVADVFHKAQRSSNGIAYAAVATAPEVYSLAVFQGSLYGLGNSRAMSRADLSGSVWATDSPSSFSSSASPATFRMHASPSELGAVGIQTGSFGGGGADDARCHIHSKSGGVWTEHANPFPDVLDTSVSSPCVHYAQALGLWIVTFYNRVAYGPSLSSLTLSAHVFSSDVRALRSDGGKVIVCGTGGLLERSADGNSWTSMSDGPAEDIYTIATFWNGGTSIPDAPGWYVNPDGAVQGPSYSTLTPCSTTTIGEIVAELCEMSGLTSDEYDVSELTDTLTGYVVARETDAASVIESLRPIGMFDPAEWDGKVRFVKRGGTAVGSINGDDLVERDGDAYEREIVQEAELLRRVTTGYLDPATAFAPNTQKYERRAGTVQAKGEATFEVSAVMGADQAATVAKRKVLTAWGEPEKQKLSLPYRLAKYTPTDVLNYTHSDDEVHTIRLMQIEDDAGIRYVESSLNCAEAYNATATGTAPKPPTVTDESLFGPTILVPMNLDSLRAQDNVPGMYFAATGVLGGWQGCVVQMSTDGGTTYRDLVTIIRPATMGYLSASVGTSSEPIPVTLYASGQLSSATPTQLADGANAAAIVTLNVAEIVQYETATATSTGYDLTDITRGVNDTDPAAHIDRDSFVVLDANVIFAPISSDFSGQTLMFRAVTLGTSADAAPAVSIVYEPPTFVLDGGGA